MANRGDCRQLVDSDLQQPELEAKTKQYNRTYLEQIFITAETWTSSGRHSRSWTMKLASQQRSWREGSDRKLQECEEFVFEIPAWMNIVRGGLIVSATAVGGALYLSNSKLRKTLSHTFQSSGYFHIAPGYPEALQFEVMSVSYAPTKLRVPLGFEHLLEALAREVLREQPKDIINFAAEYFRRKLVLRDGETIECMFGQWCMHRVGGGERRREG